MKKVLALLMVAGIFSLVACGPTEEEKAKAEADAAAMVEEMMGGLEEAMEEPAEEEVAETEEVEAVEGEEAAEEGHEHAEGEEHSEEEAH